MNVTVQMQIFDTVIKSLLRSWNCDRAGIVTELAPVSTWETREKILAPCSWPQACSTLAKAGMWEANHQVKFLSSFLSFLFVSPFLSVCKSYLPNAFFLT